MSSFKHLEISRLSREQYLDIDALRQNNWFLKRLDTHIEKHFSDGDLNVGHLLQTIGMSRTSLHRNLNKLTGMSTTEYIRYCKLRRAMKLLEECPEQNMFEIAISVGFNNQSYFTKKFKEAFGCCPRKYRERKFVEEKAETFVLKMKHVW